jgi:nitrile hydratase accessory protein
VTDERGETAGESEAGGDGDREVPDVPGALGGGEDAPTFEAPWQARAFALAVALTDEDDDALPWDEFQRRPVEEIDAGDGGADEKTYYRRWLAALERLLVERDRLDPGELTDRVAEFEAGDRSGHEFVEGDPRAHADRLPKGHAEGSGHSHEHDHDHEHGH